MPVGRLCLLRRELSVDFFMFWDNAESRNSLSASQLHMVSEALGFVVLDNKADGAFSSTDRHTCVTCGPVPLPDTSCFSSLLHCPLPHNDPHSASSLAPLFKES